MIHNIYMINWDEPNFEENHARAENVLGVDVKVVSGIKGIHQAHVVCAKDASSEFFWCIDGDNWLYDTAWQDMENTEHTHLDTTAVHVMRAKNPFNGLVYGHGAMKLFPKMAFLNHVNLLSVDMTSGMLLNYKIIHRLTSEHRYNSSAFHTWRTAFRECVKLSSSIIKNQIQKETDERLLAWCNTKILQDIDWAEENINGAVFGRDWAKKNLDSLGLINDFDILKDLFDKCSQ